MYTVSRVDPFVCVYVCACVFFRRVTEGRSSSVELAQMDDWEGGAFFSLSGDCILQWKRPTVESKSALRLIYGLLFSLGLGCAAGSTILQIPPMGNRKRKKAPAARGSSGMAIRKDKAPLKSRCEMERE